MPKKEDLELEDKIQTYGRRKVIIDHNDKLVKFISFETFQIHSVILTFSEVEKVCEKINN